MVLKIKAFADGPAPWSPYDRATAGMFERCNEGWLERSQRSLAANRMVRKIRTFPELACTGLQNWRHPTQIQIVPGTLLSSEDKVLSATVI